MGKRNLLLEIGLEEMPARFINDAMNTIGSRITGWLLEHNIDFGDVTLFSTPRRLAVLVKDVAESQPDTVEEAKGPAKKIALDEEGKWSKAALGFCRGQNVAPEDLYFKDIKGVEYIHVKKHIKGKPAIELFPELGRLAESIHFPKSMRWGNNELRYVRPIRWITALFGTEVIPVSIAHIQSSNKTFGHRFLGEQIPVLAAEDYEKVLLGQYVIADSSERKSAIRDQLERLEEEKGWKIPIDEDLLEEVTNLVEYPTVFHGGFDERYLSLPEEVLITSMKEHQRYFPVKDQHGRLLPYFVAVRNGDHRHLETVARGNEKVLRARLSDADFFYQEDQKLDMGEALEKLKAIVYHEKIGTLSQKVSRIRHIAGMIGRRLEFGENDIQKAERAAELSKFDLVTHMVGEFPELQGIMGEKYARQQRESEEVAMAINDHYKPRHAEDSIPRSAIGSVVALADKLDTIVSSFAIGLIPTGSQDPYALRRQAAGVIQILTGQGWDLSLNNMLKDIIKIVQKDLPQADEQLLNDLLPFFKLRIRHMLLDSGIRHDLVEAVLESEVHSVPQLIEKASVLNRHKEDPDFKETIEALARVLNISGKAEGDARVDPSLFENEYEQNLYSCFLELEESYKAGTGMESRFEELASLRKIITDYFDHTMVMAEQAEQKKNRLAQMKKLSAYIGDFADMGKILVK
ncbi:MAG TPA: glycine--tRNA ligase subunit beta [Bacillaceae bacterium]